MIEDKIVVALVKHIQNLTKKAKVNNKDETLKHLKFLIKAYEVGDVCNTIRENEFGYDESINAGFFRRCKEDISIHHYTFLVDRDIVANIVIFNKLKKNSTKSDSTTIATQCMYVGSEYGKSVRCLMAFDANFVYNDNNSVNVSVDHSLDLSTNVRPETVAACKKKFELCLDSVLNLYKSITGCSEEQIQELHDKVMKDMCQ